MSPSPEHLEYAQMLLRRARGDLRACELLAADADIDDSAIGFHAQQCVERALKMALVTGEVELPRTHDLELLAEKAQASGLNVPDALADADWLTPWAAAFRYEEPSPLDRNAALAAAESAIAWAASLVAG